MAVTSHDVARLAGVSQPTVSRALRGDPRVAEPTRARVLRAAAELGYVASQLGRSLSTQLTGQVAMVAHHGRSIYPTLIAPVHDRLADHGLRMVLIADRGDGATLDRLLGHSVDGVVLTTTLLHSSLSQELLDRGVPVVELSRVSDHPGVDGLVVDDRRGGAASARLLLEAGHRRIGAIFGLPTTSIGRDREAGFRAELNDVGVRLLDEHVAHADVVHADGERGFEQVMSGADRPTAIFCVSDIVAIGAVNQARRMGLSVPDDVAIIGFDDLPIASWPTFRLTTTRIDLPAMAAAATDVLVNRIGGDTSPAEVRIFPTEVVLRDTHRRTA